MLSISVRFRCVYFFSPVFYHVVALTFSSSSPPPLTLVQMKCFQTWNIVARDDWLGRKYRLVEKVIVISFDGTDDDNAVDDDDDDDVLLIKNMIVVIISINSSRMATTTSIMIIVQEN